MSNDQVVFDGRNNSRDGSSSAANDDSMDDGQDVRQKQGDFNVEVTTEHADPSPAETLLLKADLPQQSKNGSAGAAASIVAAANSDRAKNDDCNAAVNIHFIPCRLDPKRSIIHALRTRQFKLAHQNLVDRFPRTSAVLSKFLALGCLICWTLLLGFVLAKYEAPAELASNDASMRKLFLLVRNIHNMAVTIKLGCAA